MRGTNWRFVVVFAASAFSPPSRPPAEPPDLGKAIREATADGTTSDATAVSWYVPRTGSYADWEIHVLARGPDNALWHKSKTGGTEWAGEDWKGTWSGWESLGGSLSSGPDVVSWGTGRLDVFVRGMDNGLWHKSFAGGQWSGWESLGGVFTSDPAAVSWGPGRLDVFARGQDDALWHIAIDNGWSRWSAWERLGGILTSGPTAASWGPGRIDVFARMGDRSLQHKSFEKQWSGWESLGGGLTSDPSAAAWYQDIWVSNCACYEREAYLFVFARGADNALWHTWFNGSWQHKPGWSSTLSGGWSGWTSLGNVLTSGPAATARAGTNHAFGRLDVFARGGDNTLYHTWFNSGQMFAGWKYPGAGWSGWESLGAPPSPWVRP